MLHLLVFKKALFFVTVATDRGGQPLNHREASVRQRCIAIYITHMFGVLKKYSSKTNNNKKKLIKQKQKISKRYTWLT